jgi:HEAT repeat protein
MLVAAAILTGCETSRDELAAKVNLNAERTRDLDKRNREVSETVDSLRGQVTDLQLALREAKTAVGQLRLDLQRMAEMSPTLEKFESEQDRKAKLGRLLTQFNTGDDAVWLEVKEGLVRIGAPCVKPLLERYAASEPLAMIRVPEVFRALVDPDAASELASGLEINSMRRICAEALGGLGNPQAIPFLKQHLADADEQTRHAVAVALGRLKDMSGVPVLLDELESDNETTRILAVGALAKIAGQDFGFRAYDKDAERRAAAVAKAREWWKNQPKPKQGKGDE